MTNKTKNIVLISGFVIVLIACYKFAILKTLEAKYEYKSLIQEEELFKNTPKQLSILKQKQKYYDSILVSNKLEGNSLQNSLLKVITGFAESENLEIVSFLEPHITSQNNLTIKTYEFVLEGNYSAIIKLIHQLEQRTKFGEIINLHFEKKKNYRTGRNYLQARVLLRSFG